MKFVDHDHLRIGAVVTGDQKAEDALRLLAWVHFGRHPEGTEKLIDTRDQRRKDWEARIQQDQTIMRAIRRDQRKAA